MSRKPTVDAFDDVDDDDGVAADTGSVLPLERQEEAVAVLDVAGRGKVDGRGGAPAAEDRGDMDRNTDALPGSQPAGIAFSPVGAGGAIVQEMGVNVDEHPLLPLLLLFGQILRQPSQTRFTLIGNRQLQISVGGNLFLQRAVIIVHIVEIIDGRFSG